MKKIFKIGNKTVGTLQNGIFHKEVFLSRHLFRALNAFGFDSDILHKLPNGTKIELHELEEDKWYRTTKEEFLRLGETYLHFKHAEDFRTQLFLPLRHWKIEEPPVLTEDQKAEREYKKVLGLV